MSSSGTSDVINYPGPGWSMLWKNGKTAHDGFKNFQLDIVGFLAVLGEGSVTANAQVAALSPLFYLPRLIPAPQALLWTSRPAELQPTKATVTGVESGIVKEHVHYVANVLLGGEMAPMTVRCVEVNKADDRHRKKTFKERIFGIKAEDAYEMKEVDTEDSDKEHGKRTPIGPAVVTAKANGPLAWITLASCFLSIIMLILSLLFGDGMSFIATLLLSFLSTLIGVVNKSTLNLPQRPKGSVDEEKKHVVVRYPNGSFLVVKCDEHVARELYFAPEEIKYELESLATYRLISLIGTIMLMGGVIFLANARLELQFAWAVVFIITNILHWIAAAVPPRMHWDLTCYIVREHGITCGANSDSFTEALWKCIVFTKNVQWIETGNAAPKTAVWKEWCEEMLERAETLDCHRGPLSSSDRVNSRWRDQDNPDEPHIIWDVPARADFNAKGRWDEINQRHRLEKGQNFDRPTVGGAQA